MHSSPLLFQSSYPRAGGTDTVRDWFGRDNALALHSRVLLPQSVAINSSFFLMMAVYPEVQSKAQAELDAVISRDRLARIEDRSSLPYIEALIKELHRFRPITPLAPHTTLVDDEYKGYRIPKGSWVMANTRCASFTNYLFASASYSYTQGDYARCKHFPSP